jgi:hypothetical protein
VESAVFQANDWQPPELSTTFSKNSQWKNSKKWATERNDENIAKEIDSDGEVDSLMSQ